MKKLIKNDLGLWLWEFLHCNYSLFYQEPNARIPKVVMRSLDSLYSKFGFVEVEK